MCDPTIQHQSFMSHSRAVGQKPSASRKYRTPPCCWSQPNSSGETMKVLMAFSASSGSLFLEYLYQSIY